MKKVQTLLIYFFSFAIIQAQGIYNFSNKNTIGYSVNVAKLSYLKLNSKDNLSIGLLQHQLVMQRVLTKKTSLVLNYMLTKETTDLNFNRSSDMAVIGSDSLGFNPKVRLLEPNGNITFRARVISFGVRTYIAAKGAIAPYGRYFEFKTGYGQIHYRKEDDNITFKYNDGYRLKNDGLNEGLSNYGIDHLNLISLQAGYGDSKPIFKNLFLDMMINFSWSIPLWKGDVNSNEVLFRDLYLYRSARVWYGVNNRVRYTIGLHYGF